MDPSLIPPHIFPKASQINRAIFFVSNGFLTSTEELFAADPNDYPDDIQNYLWTWTDRERGEIRSRMFAANLGVPEDEATGAAAVRITDYLSRDLTIVQGKGSMIHTQWSPEGWVRIAGRVVSDGVKQIG